MRHITYISIITILYSTLYLIITQAFLGNDQVSSIVHLILVLLEVLLLCRLVGARNIFKVYTTHVLFYVLSMVFMSIFITVNVTWFVDSIFNNRILGHPRNNDYYFTTSLLNFIYINLISNYLLFKYKKDEASHHDTSLTQSEQLKKEAELYKLRQQVDPHFLFNSLNSINALTHIDQGKASQMIFSLSQYFRNNIQKQDQDKITLREEIADIRLYLSIELVRFGHRLQIIEDIDDNILDREIPPLLLQPLIENAIKYGIYGTSDHVSIHINIQNHINDNGHERTDCIISNPYDPNTHINSGTGFGIAGIMRRLYLTYNRNDLLRIEKIKKDNTHLFKARLSIPHFTHNK